MPKNKKIQLTSADAGKKCNSLVRVYDAKTGRLKRIETQDGKVCDYSPRLKSGA